MKARLRPLSDADSDLLFKWINTHDLVVLSSPFRPVGREDHEKWFRKIRSSEDVRIFAIASSEDGSTLGYCQLRKIDRVSRKAELQIRIGESDMQGRGLGTQAVRKLVQFGFEELGLHRIYLQVFQSNERAQKTYLKCGFSNEGLQRQAVCIDGSFEDILMMGILSGEQR